MFIIYLGAMGSRAVKVNNQRVMPLEKSWFSWLVVSTPPKNISQLGLLFPRNGKIKAMFQTTNQLVLNVFNPRSSQEAAVLGMGFMC